MYTLNVNKYSFGSMSENLILPVVRELASGFPLVLGVTDLL